LCKCAVSWFADYITSFEFIAKCGDSLRELEETAYWLELLVDANCATPEKLSFLRRECDELIAIFVAILKSSKEAP
jgi:four helix bundle protein